MPRLPRMLTPWLLLSLAAAQVQPEPAPWQARLQEASRSPDLWKARRAEIRRQILVAAGLFPEFDRPPLKPEIFGRVEGDGYSVERVVLETLPGFYLSGSLYRPRAPGGPFPAVLSPHGHWKEGRFTQEKVGNLPARGVTFARLGFVCFMYDMVGFGDFQQLPHRFEDLDWGQNLLGLQTWNSLRAVDFLSALPDVDPHRIGCTGASGGGTQTFLLTAIDDRIACSAPVNMVAAEFQGGCSCENAPFLRIGLNNVEIAAMAAPRPMLLIAATGDWTKTVPVFEAPAVQKVYDRLGAPEKFRVVQFDAPHNYNQDSRETVYAWMQRWLQGRPDQPRVAEPPVGLLPRQDLAVWSEAHPRPAGAVGPEALRTLLRDRVRQQLATLEPRNAASLRRYRELLEPAWKLMLSAQPPGHPSSWAGTGRATVFVATAPELAQPYLDEFKRHGRPGDAQTALIFAPHAPEAPSGGDASQRRIYQTTFYRTELARQVQDILDLVASISASPLVQEIRLVGIGEAGLATVLARAISPSRVGLTIADLSGVEAAQKAFPHPGLHRLGGWPGALLLAPAGIMILHGSPIDPGPIRASYRAAGRESACIVSEAVWSRDRILEELGR